MHPNPSTHQGNPSITGTLTDVHRSATPAISDGSGQFLTSLRVRGQPAIAQPAVSHGGQASKTDQNDTNFDNLGTFDYGYDPHPTANHSRSRAA